MNAAITGGILLLAIACITAGVAILFGGGWALVAFGMQLGFLVIAVPRLRVEIKPHG